MHTPIRDFTAGGSDAAGSPPGNSPERHVKRIGHEAGFNLVRITSAQPLEREGRRYVEWIEQGRQAEMRWITPEHARRCSEPQTVLSGARSVITVGLGYWSGMRPEKSLHGRVARYAWGPDYHQVLGERLASFAARLQEEFGAEYRWHVDTGPLMDKALATRSGLGWYGKNSNILTEELGSFLFLGEIVTTLGLMPDVPLDRNCGSCRLCAVACPTGAIGPEYSIDAGKCISYLTIEHRAAIPLQLRPQMGDWVFGCDICQDVCPPTMRPYLQTDADRRRWARGLRGKMPRQELPASAEHHAQEDELATASPGEAPGLHDHRCLDLLWLLRLTHAEYLDAFRGTAIRRAKVWMLRRNAAIALGNVGDEGVLPPLLQAAETDDHPVVRGHAAWAMGEVARRLGRPSLCEPLRAGLAKESDESVRGEISRALQSAGCDL